MSSMLRPHAHRRRPRPPRNDDGVQTPGVLDDRAIRPISPDHNDVPSPRVAVMGIDDDV
jgi:hypothetical protein